MQRNISSLHFIIFCSLILFHGCKPKEEDGHIKIVTTTSILRDIVSNLVPSHIEVESLMGPGVDPHLYKASQGDVKRLCQADIIIYNGLHLEGKMGEVLNRLKRTKDVYAFAEIIDPADLRIIDSTNEFKDPHTWFNLNLTRLSIDELELELIRILPQDSTQILFKTQKYLEELQLTHEWCLSTIDSISPENRILITSHDAFGYFGEAYNFEVRGLQGISTMAESGLKDVTDMVNFIIDNKVKAIFVENSVSQKALRSVMEGCKRKGHAVEIGGELYSDALGQDRTPEGTYLGMVKYNVQTISDALK